MRNLWHRARFEVDHRWAPERMSAYLDGDLSSGARIRIERHLGECDKCRRLLAGLRALLDLLHRRPVLSYGTQADRIAAAVRLRLSDPPRAE
jgi:anti-sigma factor RsiW